MTDDRLYLDDIFEAIERIERYTGADRVASLHDELVQTWVVHHIQIIGEAARALSADLKARHPDVPWRDIVRMRNILVHQYFDVDVGVVRSVVAHDLPSLKQRVMEILRSEFGGA